MSNKIPFHELTFDKFKELAQSEQLSNHEKVGFPNEYRQGKEELIFADILAKLRSLEGAGKTILEIGPGCSHLPMMLAALCKDRGHRLHFVDSQEMLAHLPEEAFISKWPGRYPDDVGTLFTQLNSRVDTVIAYSVIQYVFVEGNLWDFLDRTLGLLAEGGEIILGDIPNITMRKRFFSSAAGAKCHREYTGCDEPPVVRFNQLEPGHMDDSVVLSILTRARAQGFHAWVVPQGEGLPMANRREDILIRRP